MDRQEPIEVNTVSREGVFMVMHVNGEIWKLLKGHMDPDFYKSFDGGTIYGVVSENGGGAFKDYLEFFHDGKKIYPIYNGIFPMYDEII